MLGSRYIAGGSTDKRWTIRRRLNSKVARLLARLLTSVKDPTSGFFALRRATFLSADELTPIGYKIGLELLVKCRCNHVREVPIHFSERLLGTTKLGLRERIQYLRQICRLMLYWLGKRNVARKK